MKKQSRGWLSIALCAALLAPAAAPRSALAAPFGYVSAADNQKKQAPQEQDHRQADERDRQQREQQARQRGEQEQRSRQEQQARQAQEQQARQAQQRQLQEQQQRQAEQRQQQQRQAEQQQLQRQAEQQRAERQRQAEQQREIERQRQAERAQQERMRAVQQQRQQTEQQRARQAQPANEQQTPQVRVEQRAREEQLRRAREEQTVREQVRRAREEQAGSARRVSTGPFGYIRRTDEVRSQAQPQSQVQQPAQRESRPVVRQDPARPGREEQRSVPRSTPFHAVPEQPGRPTRIPAPQGTLAPHNGPGYRTSPFGTARPGAPPVYRRPEPHTEISRPAGTFPPNAGSPRGTFPGGTVRSGPFGNGRDHREVGTPAPPIRRGGHGSLDSYFGRPPRRHRETVRGGYYPAPYYPGGYYPEPYGGYYPYGPSYYYPSPYDYYPPLYYPAPGPTIIETPPPEVVIVPAPDTVIEPEAVESVSLDDVIADVEEAWEGGKLDLLTRHLLPEAQVQIYRDGEWVDSMSRAQFEQKTEQAFRDYDTLSMRFEKPELLADDETGTPRARARATHIYKTRSGQEQRVTVTYAFRRYGRVWRIVGLDYEPQPRQRAALPPPRTEGTEDLKGAAASLAGVPSHAAARHPRASAPELRLASAPAVRVRDLLRAHQPRPIATVKWVQAPRKTVYTLQAMRGVAPGTIAWALYRQGAKRPAETGVTDISALPPNGWMAVQVQQPQLVTLASSSPARPRSARLAIHSFAGTGLVLTAAHAPVKTAPRGRHRASRRR